MSRQTKYFGPNKRVATRSSRNKPNRPRSKILVNAMKQYEKHQTLMRHTSLVDGAKIVNDSVAKGASMSNHGVERTSKGMKQPTASSFKDHSILMEKQKDLSRSTIVGKAKLKEPHAKRKGEVNDTSRPTYLKAMQGLVSKTTNRLGQYSDSSTRFKKQARSDNRNTKREFSVGIYMAPKDSCTIKGNDKQDEMVIDNDKENVRFGEYMEGDTTKAKRAQDSILSDNHCNSGSISSYPFGRDLPDFQKDKHSMNLTFQNDEEIGLTKINMGQIANCNGKDSNSMPKKRKEPSFEENHKAHDDDSNVGVQVDNISYKQMKKLKGECSGDPNHIGLEDDFASILKNDQAKLTMPSCVEQQCYSCSKPIDKPTWSGILKTNDKEYISLDGHLSTKSCEKAWNLSRQFLKVVEVKKLSRLEVWPKAWEVSTPTGNDIGIYLFPHEMRQDEGLDQLVKEVIQNDLALRATIGEAEMLIFPSIILPNRHQTFQGKHYLWGVFKRRKDKGVVVEKPISVVGHCEMENQQNVVSDRPNHMLPVEEPNQETIQMVSVIPLETHMLPPNKCIQEVEASHLKWPTNKAFDLKAPGEKGTHAEVTPITTHAATFPAIHEQVNPSMLHSADRLMGFVVRKTPKLDRIIRELEEEGALVFAMQGEMVGAGSWAGSKATTTQK